MWGGSLLPPKYLLPGKGLGAPCRTPTVSSAPHRCHPERNDAKRNEVEGSVLPYRTAVRRTDPSTPLRSAQDDTHLVLCVFCEALHHRCVIPTKRSAWRNPFPHVRTAVGVRILRLRFASLRMTPMGVRMTHWGVRVLVRRSKYLPRGRVLRLRCYGVTEISRWGTSSWEVKPKARASR